jgi:hypothetical protein
MVRARLAGVALATALGLACGCTAPSGCSECGSPSLTSRLTGLFRRHGTPTEVVGSPIEGPVIADPGGCDGPGCGAALPPTFSPPPPAVLPPDGFPPPQSFPPPLTNEAQRMPYQP